MPYRRVKSNVLGKPASVIPERADEEAIARIGKILVTEFHYNGHTGIASVMEMIIHAALREPEFLKRAIPELAARNGKKLPEEITGLPKD